MANYIQISNKLYIGAAADVKPTSQVEIGAWCLEWDTDKKYVTYNGSTWVQQDAIISSPDLTTLVAAVGAIEGATTLHAKLTAARAALLDQITAVRLAELDAANLPADIDGIKAKTVNLPSDPADESLVEAAIAAVDSTARKRQAGRAQIFQVAVTSAANAGAVTLATITTQSCLVEAIIVKAVTAAQTDLTSAAVTGGASGVISFLDAVDAAKANIDAIDEQVSWKGQPGVELAATKTIVMTLAGTGATAVNLLVTIEYVACVDGGYLA